MLSSIFEKHVYNTNGLKDVEENELAEQIVVQEVIEETVITTSGAKIDMYDFMEVASFVGPQETVSVDGLQDVTIDEEAIHVQAQPKHDTIEQVSGGYIEHETSARPQISQPVLEEKISTKVIPSQEKSLCDKLIDKIVQKHIVETESEFTEAMDISNIIDKVVSSAKAVDLFSDDEILIAAQSNKTLAKLAIRYFLVRA